ncbi:MAG: shikimate kinase [Chthoniobacteraceae bacterium]
MTEAAQKHDLPENIVLIGFMGTGKSTVGRMLARQLQSRFLDTDKAVEAGAHMTIPEIFAKHGEDDFRKRETAVLESLCHTRRHIIATGGGIVTVPENIPLLRSLGLVVMLKAEPDEIYRRVSRNTARPLLQVEDPRKRVLELMAARKPLYESAAHFQVDSTRLRHEDVTAKIMEEAHRFFHWPKPARA